MSPKTPTIHSPFKFLDAYQKEDIDIFFGREQETENLYHALSGVKHLLVYGPSGAGKTSLIECGLRNQFSDADWYALTIRKGTNITVSVFNAINEALEVKIELDEKTNLPKDENINFEEAVQYLFEECYQPVYLLFDQFEELLISGTKAEQVDFFKRLNQLIRNRVPCRILLIMREEFIGHLSEFEQYCPTLFQHRFRLEKIRLDNVRDVIIRTLLAPQFIADFKVEEADILADTILSKLPDNRKEIELTHVQVFLSELWDRAYDNNPEQPILEQGLVQQSDNLERILDSFLQKQLQAMEMTHGEKIPLEVLACMISERHTKLQLIQQHIQEDLDKKSVTLNTNLSDIITDFIQRKILRTVKINNITHYEISHDILALVIGKSLTEEMQLRQKAMTTYQVYQAKQGHFSQDDLDHLRPLNLYLPFPDELQQRIEESEQHLKNEQEAELKAIQAQADKEAKLRKNAEIAQQEAELEKAEADKQREQAEYSTKKATRFSRIAAIIAVVAALAAVFAVTNFFDARDSETKAIEALSDAKKEKRNAEISDSLAQIDKAAALIAKTKAEEKDSIAQQKAIEALAAEQNAKQQETLAKASEQKAKTALNEIAQREVKSGFTAVEQFQWKKALEHLKSANQSEEDSVKAQVKNILTDFVIIGIYRVPPEQWQTELQPLFAAFQQTASGIVVDFEQKGNSILLADFEQARQLALEGNKKAARKSIIYVMQIKLDKKVVIQAMGKYAIPK